MCFFNPYGSYGVILSIIGSKIKLRFSAYWTVPAEEKTVKNGKWEKGPGMSFFKKVINKFGNESIIAEDLGDIDANVVKLLEQTGFPGMRVIQFGFISDDDNTHLPHNHVQNCVAYTGTHDNETVIGWLFGLTEEQRNNVLEYCSFQGKHWREGGPKSQSVRAIIKTLMMPSSNLVVMPIQDLCGYGNDTRMNTQSYLYRL